MTRTTLRSALLPLFLAALCATPVTAQQSFDTVKHALRAAEAGSVPTHRTTLLREVLVTTEPKTDADSDNYTVTFHVSDFERVNGEARILPGPAIRVSMESYWSGHHLFDEDNDDPHEYEVAIEVKKGDVITVAGHLERDWDDDAWELKRTFESDLWDGDLYEVYADGFDDVEDYGYALSVLSRNWGLDDIDDFRTDPHAAASDLDEFNDFLANLGFARISTTSQVDDRFDEIDGADNGLRAVITVHEGNVQPVTLQPRITYVRPYTILRQGMTAVVKVDNAGLFPKLRLGRREIAIEERLPGLLLIKIPRRARTGQRTLTLLNEDGDRSRPFKIWIKKFAPASNPAPELGAATVVGSPESAVLVLEGDHFRQEGALSVYLGRRKLTTIVRREARVVIARIPAGLRGTTARVRVGRQVSNSVGLSGGRWLSAPARSGSASGAAGALGGLGN